MTALEEIKKAEHERIWLEPAGAPDRCWCQDNQWGDEGVEYVLASTLESLQREKEELRRDLSHEASHRQKLQNALAYWIPGVTEEIEISTNGRCGDDALLLVGSEGPLDDKCWGNEAIARAEAAEAEVKRLKAERLYIIGFNDGWEAAVGEPPEDASALSAQVQDVSGALREVFERWRDGYGFNEDSDEDVALLDRAAAPAKQEG